MSCYSLIYVILCVWLSLKMIMVVWSTPASSEEVGWTLNAEWTVATLLSQCSLTMGIGESELQAKSRKIQ